MKDKSNGIPLTDMSSVGQDSLGYLRPDSNKIDKRQMNGPEFPGNLKPNSSENQNVDLSSDQKYSFGQESQSYIHPTTVKENAESPVSPVSSDGRLRTPRGMKGKRFDSGVADLEQISPQLSMDAAPKFRPPSKYNYDYADYGGHQYEELPHNREKYHRGFMASGESEHQSSGGTTVSEIQSEMDDTAAIVRANEKRKRVNPLYDGVHQSTPSIYTKSRSVKDAMLQKQISCLKTIVALLILLLLMILALTIYTLILQFQEQQKMQRDVDNLQKKYSALQNQFVGMEQLLGTNDTTHVISGLLDKIDELQNKSNFYYTDLENQMKTTSISINEYKGSIVETYGNMTKQLSSLNNTIHEQMDNITRTPGPQGPQGVGNLSACFYKNITHTKIVNSGSPPSTTLWYPHHKLHGSITIDEFVPMFVSCSVEGGTFHQIETNVITENKVQYRCYCEGYVADLSDRKCYMHLWLCPRISGPPI